MKLTICIPTYNRLHYLKKNLHSLCRIIIKENLQEDVSVFVSDNCSDDGTGRYMEESAGAEKDVIIHYHRNEKNIGVIKNFIYLAEHADSEYIMILGDDDYISGRYLLNAYKAVKNGGISCVIPGYLNIDTSGIYTGRGRDIGKRSKIYESGFENCLQNSWRGHQMSGLVFLRDAVCQATKNLPEYNLYITVYWAAYMCMHGRTLHLTKYPVRVTRPPQEEKTWGYGDAGLIPDIFHSYKWLEGITPFERHRLEMKVLIEQYWRYAMYLKKGWLKFMKCICSIAASGNTSLMTRLVFPAALPFILAGQGFLLLCRGKLFDTLRTKVDI